MPSCVIKWCKNNTKVNKKSEGISFHTLPTNILTRDEWVAAIRHSRNDSQWQPSSRSVVCSEHFDKTDMYDTQRGLRRIHRTGYPKKNLFPPSNAVDSNILSPNISLPFVLNSPVSPSVVIDSNCLVLPSISSAAVLNQDSPCNEIKVFCPKCNTEVPHTAEGMQQDQTKILIAKVYHYFEHEYEELKKIYGYLELTPMSKFGQRTALATGVSETTVLQILKEEEERNANKEQELPEKRKARKRSRQTDSLSEEDSSDDNLDDGGQSSFTEVAQNEPEIETLVVKLEPPEYKEQAEADPISIEVKAEPPDHGVNSTNETLALSDPAGTKHKARKIPKTYTRRQHTQGESSTAAAASSVRLTEELDESGLSEESEVKEEKIEIGEEGFS